MGLFGKRNQNTNSYVPKSNSMIHDTGSGTAYVVEEAFNQFSHRGYIDPGMLNLLREHVRSEQNSGAKYHARRLVLDHGKFPGWKEYLKKNGIVL